MFSGYENFVSKMDHSGHRDWPEWMGAIDFTALKIKLLGSIVAISAIQLLKQFMDVRTASDRDLMWYVIIHVVVRRLERAARLSDRISGEAKSAKALTSEPGGRAARRRPPQGLPIVALPRSALLLTLPRPRCGRRGRAARSRRRTPRE